MRTFSLLARSKPVGLPRRVPFHLSGLLVLDMPIRPILPFLVMVLTFVVAEDMLINLPVLLPTILLRGLLPTIAVLIPGFAVLLQRIFAMRQ